MRKRFAFIVSYLAVLVLLTLGAAILCLSPKEERLSESENRMLSAFPAFSGAAVRSGEFMDGFESFLSDGFPARDALVGASRELLSVFGEADEDAAVQEAIAREERLAEESRTEPPLVPDETGTGPALPETPGDVPETENAAPAAPPSAAPVKSAEHDASLWLVKRDGTRHVQETYPAENLEKIAPVLDEYRACLPEDGKVLFINVPVSSYYHNLTAADTYVDWGSDVDEVLQPMVGEGVYIYDATDILRPYLETEDLYPTGDHHWHAISAWHVAHAMTEDLGLPATEFYDYQYKLEFEFRGNPYTPEQMQSMTISRQNRRYPVPVTPVESYILKYMTKRSPSVYLESDRFPGYGVYLGGRWRPWRLFVTGYHTGRTALVIGDSFYHAFLPYMTPCYDRILSTDLRSDMYIPELAGGSIRQYIEKYGVDDVYFVMCSYTSLNDYVYQDRLERYLNTDYGAIYGRGDG